MQLTGVCPRVTGVWSNKIFLCAVCTCLSLIAYPHTRLRLAPTRLYRNVSVHVSPTILMALFSIITMIGYWLGRVGHPWSSMYSTHKHTHTNSAVYVRLSFFASWVCYDDSWAPTPIESRMTDGRVEVAEISGVQTAQSSFWLLHLT